MKGCSLSTADNLRSSCREYIVVPIAAVLLAFSEVGCGRGEAEALSLSSSDPMVSGETPGFFITMHVAHPWEKISAENDVIEHGITCTISSFCPGIVAAVKEDTDAEMISNWVAFSVTLVLSGVVNMVHVLCPNPLDVW
jgi:hypothetical protein